jgi:predicted nucleic acid-binding protein
VIVVDASAAMAAALRDGAARRAMGEGSLAAPDLFDVEVASGLRSMVARGLLDPEDGRRALGTVARLGLRRHRVTPLLGRIWALRDTLTAYDAAYVALAEVLACPLLTADGRLARAPGVRCAVTVVPG